MNVTLYAVTVLIWGSTWLAIKYQLGDVHPTASITYRFALAALVLFAWAAYRRLPLRFPARQHRYLVPMGGLMFSGNFVCFYFSEQYLTTGLVAIIFAMSLLINMIFARVFFRRTLGARVLVAGAVGLLGITVVFWPELVGFSLTSSNGRGIVLAVVGTLLFCLGNVVSGKAQATGLPVIQSTAYAMAYGALLLAPVAFVAGDGYTFDPSFAYTSSLLYLVIFGSVIGFSTYLTLLGRIGGERAAYATVLFPIVALLLSTFFEDFHWTLRDVLGVLLILVGNAVVLTRPATLRRLLGRPPEARAEPAAPRVVDQTASETSRASPK
jgi:drug/metabolite transporter (DMT)-like permease